MHDVEPRHLSLEAMPTKGLEPFQFEQSLHYAYKVILVGVGKASFFGKLSKDDRFSESWKLSKCYEGSHYEVFKED